MVLKSITKVINRLISGVAAIETNMQPTTSQIDQIETKDSNSISNLITDDLLVSTSHHSTQSTDTIVIGDEDNDKASAGFVTASYRSTSEESNIERLVERQVEQNSTKTRLKEELMLNFYLSKECLEAKETVEKVLEKNIKLENDLVRVNKEAKEMEIKCQEEIEKLRRQEAARNKDMAKLNEYVRLLERRVEMFSRIAQASVQVRISLNKYIFLHFLVI